MPNVGTSGISACITGWVGWPAKDLATSACHQPSFVRATVGSAEADGLLAFVISVSTGTREELEQQVLQQGRAQLGLDDLQAATTIVEKRATFACTPGLARPGTRIAPGLSACGEYVEGPYPGTIEGAVRSALDAVATL